MSTTPPPSSPPYQPSSPPYQPSTLNSFNIFYLTSEQNLLRADVPGASIFGIVDDTKQMNNQPTDLMGVILSFLNFSDCLAAAATCLTWRYQSLRPIVKNCRHNQNLLSVHLPVPDSNADIDALSDFHLLLCKIYRYTTSTNGIPAARVLEYGLSSHVHGTGAKLKVGRPNHGWKRTLSTEEGAGDLGQPLQRWTSQTLDESNLPQILILAHHGLGLLECYDVSPKYAGLEKAPLLWSKPYTAFHVNWTAGICAVLHKGNLYLMALSVHSHSTSKNSIYVNSCHDFKGALLAQQQVATEEKKTQLTDLVTWVNIMLVPLTPDSTVSQLPSIHKDNSLQVISKCVSVALGYKNGSMELWVPDARQAELRDRKTPPKHMPNHVTVQGPPDNQSLIHPLQTQLSGLSAYQKVVFGSWQAEEWNHRSVSAEAFKDSVFVYSSSAREVRVYALHINQEFVIPMHPRLLHSSQRLEKLSLCVLGTEALAKYKSVVRKLRARARSKSRGRSRSPGPTVSKKSSSSPTERKGMHYYVAMRLQHSCYIFIHLLYCTDNTLVSCLFYREQSDFSQALQEPEGSKYH